MMAEMSEKYYISENGSMVREFGKHLGSFEINFDWFEEGACVESAPHWERDDNCIVALCDCCPDCLLVVQCREITREEYDVARKRT